MGTAYRNFLQGVVIYSERDERPMTPSTLYIGTERGLLTYQFEDRLEPVGETLEGESVRAIAVDPSNPASALVGCGLRGWGLHRARDAGRRTESLGFDDRWVWGVAFHPTNPETVFVGTEPPAVFVSHDGGETFAEAAGLDALPSYDDWTFFHEPFFAGHVHGFAVHEDRPNRLFAGVEHGALIFTQNSGETWHERLVGHDLHRVEVDPTDPERVFAGAGAGLFVSNNGGETWEHVNAFAGKYVHGIEFDPTDADRVYVYGDVSESPVYRSDDAGETWEAVGDELPPAGPADPVVALASQPGTVLYAGDAGDDTSTLFVSDDAGETWRPTETGIPKVWRAVVVERELGS